MLHRQCIMMQHWFYTDAKGTEMYRFQLTSQHSLEIIWKMMCEPIIDMMLFDAVSLATHILLVIWKRAGKSWRENCPWSFARVWIIFVYIEQRNSSLFGTLFSHLIHNAHLTHYGMDLKQPASYEQRLQNIRKIFQKRTETRMSCHERGKRDALTEERIEKIECTKSSYLKWSQCWRTSPNLTVGQSTPNGLMAKAKSYLADIH